MGWSLVPITIWIIFRACWFVWAYATDRKTRVLGASEQQKVIENLEMSYVYRESNEL